MDCPDKRCKYSTQNSKQMERHIAATRHGQDKKVKAFKGHVTGKSKSKGKKGKR